MSDDFVLDDNCPSMQVLDQATSAIVADGQASGPWRQLVTQVKMRQPTRPSYAKSDYRTRYTCVIDGHPRTASFFEKVRGLTPRPPFVEVMWKSDTELDILGIASEESFYRATVTIDPQDIAGAVSATLREVETALRSIDASQTEAIKSKNAPAAVRSMTSSGWMGDAAANEAARTVRF